MEGNTLFPIFLKPDQLNILIVGGGFVGFEKLSAILNNNINAKITLVADYISEDVAKLAYEAPFVKLVHRKFFTSDLKDKQLLILATGNRALNEKIAHYAKSLGIITNVADTPDLCDFYLGSIVQKGDLKIAISTNGKSPTLAKRMRQYFEEEIPDSIQAVMDKLQILRNRLKGDFAYKVEALNKLTETLVADKTEIES
ncbi:MAG: bifunctional precorrin-2 dehydrogenase/sirohydrochlorin ferrochelatase [Cyclobacteriaceae bacterium]